MAVDAISALDLGGGSKDGIKATGTNLKLEDTVEGGGRPFINKYHSPCGGLNLPNDLPLSTKEDTSGMLFFSNSLASRLTPTGTELLELIDRVLCLSFGCTFFFSFAGSSPSVRDGLACQVGGRIRVSSLYICHWCRPAYHS